MRLSTAEALADGVERLTDRRQLPLFPAVFAVQVAGLVGTQSQLVAQRERLGSEATPLGDEWFPETLPLAVDVPLEAAMVLWFVAAVALVAISMVALRRFAAAGSADDLDEASSAADSPAADPTASGATATDGARGAGANPDPDLDPDPNGDGSADARIDRTSDTDGLLAATASGVAAAIVYWAAIGLGLVLLVVPGLYVAAALAFAYPVIAVERTGVSAAMRRSWELTDGRRLHVFALLMALLGLLLVVDVAGGAVTLALSSAPVLGELVNVAFGTVGWLFALATLASAFDRLEAMDAAETDRWAGIDDELLP